VTGCMNFAQEVTDFRKMPQEKHEWHKIWLLIRRNKKAP